jgi:multiple sugar transport system permease protein
MRSPAYAEKTRGWRPEWSTAYVMVLPFVLVLAGLIAYPIAWNIAISLRPEGGRLLDNYRQILSDPLFAYVTGNTLMWTAGSVTLQFLAGLGIALLLNRGAKGRAVFRAIILVLPWATPDIVAAVAWKWLYNELYGVFNDLLLRFHLIGYPIAWLGDPYLARLSVINANTWKGFSLSAMFYLAALQGVPDEITEAARVDGAGRWSTFRYVLLPYLWPTIVVTVVLTIIFTINYFPLIYIMTGGGPAEATETYVTWAYRLGFTFLDFSKSATVSTLTFLIILAFASYYTWQFTKRQEAA